MFDRLLSQYALHGNWFDLIFICLIIYLVFTNNGFISSGFDLLGLFFSLIISLNFFPFFAKLLVINFSLSKGLSKALGFFIAWVVSEIVFFMIVKLILKAVPQRLHQHKFNKILGFIPALIEGAVFFTFAVTLIFAFPVKGSIKNDVLRSKTAQPLITLSQSLESRLKTIFNDAIVETLNFLTIKQNSDKKVDLGFKLAEKDLKKDMVAEITMFNLVNKERKSQGFKSLRFDEDLRKAAQEYGQQMFLHGFFSHYSAVDGASPAERLDRHAIKYVVTGENLAYAPDVQIAHTGLMNSEGHRKNILSPEFGKVGIGVIDAGIFGKIFVQEFTD